MCTNLGGSGNTANGSGIKKMSLDGKTGSEKQRQYVQDLADIQYRNAVANGKAGVIMENGKQMGYVSKEEAESYRAAYKFLSASVDNRKTYGEVIDLLKNTSIVGLGNSLNNAAKKEGKSVSQYVEELLKKKRK